VDAGIRAALWADEEPLAEIDRLTWSPATSPQLHRPAGRVFFSHGHEPDNVLVCDVDGAAVGYVALGPASRLASNAHVLAIHGLAVAPRYQRRGIGRRLLAAAITEARRRRARRLTLRVLASNTRARRLYESLGFEIEGVQREEFLLEGRFVDDVLMALKL